MLVSDSLIVPNADIKIGNRWSVDGSNFANLMDPALLARTAGAVTLERAADHIVEGKTCRHLQAVDGRIDFEDSDSKAGKIGFFEPAGSLFFSPDDQVIIHAKLRGRAKLEKFSKNHLLFEARMRAEPHLEIHYTCQVIDTPKK